jgi:GNAT superfamily N-acetyltransferase
VHPSDHVLRRADVADADAVAHVWLRSFDAALPSVRRAHTDDEVRTWLRRVVIGTLETWVVVADGAVAAVMALDGDDLDQLYLDPDWRGRGIGDLLVMHAKSRRPAGLRLWTFQVNTPARRFYKRHGFVEIAWTDGARNDEKEPDVQLEWTPGDDAGGAVT